MQSVKCVYLHNIYLCYLLIPSCGGMWYQFINNYIEKLNKEILFLLINNYLFEVNILLYSEQYVTINNEINYKYLKI